MAPTRIPQIKKNIFETDKMVKSGRKKRINSTEVQVDNQIHKIKVSFKVFQ